MMSRASSGSVGGGHASDRRRLHRLIGHCGWVDFGSRDYKQLGTLAALSGRYPDVSQPYLTALS